MPIGGIGYVSGNSGKLAKNAAKSRKPVYDSPGLLPLPKYTNPRSTPMTNVKPQAIKPPASGQKTPIKQKGAYDSALDVFSTLKGGKR